MITLQEPTREDIRAVHTNYNVWYQGLFEQKLAPTENYLNGFELSIHQKFSGQNLVNDIYNLQVDVQ